MVSVGISALVFAVLFGGALLGAYLSPFLPAHYRNEAMAAQIKAGIGLLTSMFALLLSLQLSAGRTAFDTQESAMTVMASRTVLLDRILAHYGPETREARESLRENTVAFFNLWTSRRPNFAWAPSFEKEDLFNKIQDLPSKDETQGAEKARALAMAIDIAQMRMQIAASRHSSTAVPLMVVEIAWATIIFVSFGVFAPRNWVVVVSFLICALAVSAGFFLIVEMNTPFGGLIQRSTAPMQDAIANLGR